jgi:hypothetical protein
MLQVTRTVRFVGILLRVPEYLDLAQLLVTPGVVAPFVLGSSWLDEQAPAAYRYDTRYNL